MFATQPHTEFEFGGVVNEPKHKEGICAIDQIATLAKAAGVADDMGHPLSPGALPFVGNARYEGERWQLRIEPPAVHVIAGTPTWGCHWVFTLGAGGVDQAR